MNCTVAMHLDACKVPCSSSLGLGVSAGFGAWDSNIYIYVCMRVYTAEGQSPGKTIGGVQWIPGLGCQVTE